MILKLDHIAYSCDKNEISDVLKCFIQYEKVFYEKRLPNLINKYELLANWSHDHDIILLNCNDKIPIEITAYDSTNKGCKYSIDGYEVLVRTSSVEKSIDFYQAIGFKCCEDGSFKLKPIMDNNPLTLRMIESKESNHNKLDSSGFCCLAFITSDAKKEKKSLDRKNVFTTSIENLYVNRKSLDIFFAYNQYGDLCEFISICKEEER